MITLLLGLAIGQGCATPEAKTQALFGTLEKIGKTRYWDAGLFECDQKKGTLSEDSPTGYLMDLQNLKFVKRTKTIPAKLNTTFGLLYFVPSSYTNTTARLVYLFPPIQNPLTGKTFTSIKREGRLASKPGFYPMVYTFAEDYEMAAGKWTFQIFADDKLVVEKQFTVAHRKKP